MLKNVTLVAAWLLERFLDRIAPARFPMDFNVHDHYPVGEMPPLDPLPPT